LTVFVLCAGCFTSGGDGGNNNNPQVGDTVAYVTDWSNGVRVIDVSDPAAPVEVASVSTSHNTMDVVIQGDLAYVADWEALAPGAMVIIDVSDPANPSTVGSCAAAGGFHNHAVAGKTAFLANGTEGLRLADVSNPAAPAIVGTYDPGSAYDVAAQGNHAYLASSDGLIIFDVTDPANPARMGTFYGQQGGPAGITVDGNVAYLSNGSGGLYIVDVTDASAPAEVGNLQFGADGDTRSIFYRDGHVYITAGTSLHQDETLRIVDVGDPTAPTEVGRYDSSDHIQEIYVLDGLAYLAEGEPGLTILDVSNPAFPTRIGGLDTAGNATGVFVIKRPQAVP
jgi:hypothetical protein